MQRALSFDASPPLTVPLRFLVTAPLFMLLAAAALFWAGPQALHSRWSGSVLALTHLAVIGGLANAMTGALLQILPVATGIRAVATQLTAWVVHGCISLGALLLAIAFWQVSPPLFSSALILLTIGLLWLTIAVLYGAWRDRAHATKGSPTILLAVRLAVIALAITVLFGITLAGSMALGRPLPRSLTNLHAAWGLLGWVGLLVMGISYQVIPMFQVTERYPDFITRWLALITFIILGVLTANTLLSWEGQREANWFIASALLAAYLVYAAVTFDLLRERKRPKPDTTTLFWRSALASLGLCLPIWLLHIVGVDDFSVLLGVLFIVGFAWSAVNGMLYKILPFLLWYNTQRDLMVALPAVPKVKQFLPDEQVRPQVYAHWLAIALLVLACLWPSWFSGLAAIAFAVSILWLMMHIRQGLRLYLRAQTDIAIALAQRHQSHE